jgi:hypothetical protein
VTARVIDFKTRQVRDNHGAPISTTEQAPVILAADPVIAPVTGSMALDPPAVLTPVELFNVLYQRSAHDLMALIIFYKQTGTWNITAERLMQRAAENIKAVCASISGEK